MWWWRGLCSVQLEYLGQEKMERCRLFSLTCPVSHLLECPGGSENPCSGHGTCLDGIQQNGTCICKVSAWFTPGVLCQRELFVRCLCRCSGWRHLLPARPSAAPFIPASVSVLFWALVLSALALKHPWCGVGKNFINLTPDQLKWLCLSVAARSPETLGY